MQFNLIFWIGLTLPLVSLHPFLSAIHAGIAFHHHLFCLFEFLCCTSILECPLVSLGIIHFRPTIYKKSCQDIF